MVQGYAAMSRFIENLLMVKALISRAQLKGQKGVRLKRSATMAEAGELRDLLDTFADTVEEDLPKKLEQVRVMTVCRMSTKSLPMHRRISF